MKNPVAEELVACLAEYVMDDDSICNCTKSKKLCRRCRAKEAIAKAKKGKLV